MEQGYTVIIYDPCIMASGFEGEIVYHVLSIDDDAHMKRFGTAQSQTHNTYFENRDYMTICHNILAQILDTTSTLLKSFFAPPIAKYA